MWIASFLLVETESPILMLCKIHVIPETHLTSHALQRNCWFFFLFKLKSIWLHCVFLWWLSSSGIWCKFQFQPASLGNPSDIFGEHSIADACSSGKDSDFLLLTALLISAITLLRPQAGEHMKCYLESGMMNETEHQIGWSLSVQHFLPLSKFLSSVGCHDKLHTLNHFLNHPHNFSAMNHIAEKSAT